MLKARYHGEAVAVKQLKGRPSKEAKEALAWEVERLKEARHPNVVTYMAGCPAEPFLVTEFMELGNLNACLYTAYGHHNARFGWSASGLSVLLDAAKGARYLHSLEPPVLHNDLKPENVRRRPTRAPLEPRPREPDARQATVAPRARPVYSARRS